MTDEEVISAVKTILVQSRNGYHVSEDDVFKAIKAVDVIAGALEKCSAKVEISK